VRFISPSEAVKGSDAIGGTLARSLLSQAIDWADADPGSVVEILDGIDGAFERALVGLEQTQGSRTSALEDL